jgi:hypothetical protein
MFLQLLNSIFFLYMSIKQNWSGMCFKYFTVLYSCSVNYSDNLSIFHLLCLCFPDVCIDGWVLRHKSRIISIIYWRCCYIKLDSIFSDFLALIKNLDQNNLPSIVRSRIWIIYFDLVSIILSSFIHQFHNWWFYFWIM